MLSVRWRTDWPSDRVWCGTAQTDDSPRATVPAIRPSGGSSMKLISIAAILAVVVVIASSCGIVETVGGVDRLTRVGTT
jgi:hypothetical protein